MTIIERIQAYITSGNWIKNKLSILYILICKNLTSSYVQQYNDIYTIYFQVYNRSKTENKRLQIYFWILSHFTVIKSI